MDRVLSERRLVRQERAALDHAREEADRLRKTSRSAEEALATTRQDLAASQDGLLRRIRDLEFLGELTGLLARGGDLQRILETTARILVARFGAGLVRIEVALPGGAWTAEQGTSPAPRRRSPPWAPVLPAAPDRPERA